MIEMVCIVACGLLFYMLNDPGLMNNGTRPPSPSQRDIGGIHFTIKSSVEYELERLKTFGVQVDSIKEYFKWHTKNGRKIEKRGKMQDKLEQSTDQCQDR